MNERTLTQLAADNGFTVVKEDRDVFNTPRLISWRSTNGTVIVSVNFGGGVEHRGMAIRASRATTDELGWAAELLAEWNIGDPDQGLIDLLAPAN